jgi:hypothetical protein
MGSIDVYELNEWRAFWELEGGFGDMKQDFRTGQICSTLANVNRSKKTNPFKAEDFSLRPKHKDSRKDNTAVIMAGFDALAAQGQKKKRKKK